MLLLRLHFINKHQITSLQYRTCSTQIIHVIILWIDYRKSARWIFLGT